MGLERVPLDGEITSVCPLCQVPLTNVYDSGGLVACEPCGCSVWASVVTTFITPTGVFTWNGGTARGVR